LTEDAAGGRAAATVPRSVSGGAAVYAAARAATTPAPPTTRKVRHNSDLEGILNFKEAAYTDAQGKQRPMMEVSEIALPAVLGTPILESKSPQVSLMVLLFGSPKIAWEALPASPRAELTPPPAPRAR
jgi:hypothetical protein